ncbi:hypothetical protein [Chenggangzhangella methanolivorans]|uniref:Lipocalin-like domain-containing protein n=1 Tax=Chenggangzhangella methanolivorans TaxID=1437009 RepID=A0A9E6UK16_9HYPH|nr:hypothetical protein [Chenggangzhangella methanolivorans]QZN98711.1 hypothetical protein K6K41_17140 [Chenggangzhangella methanolivorans]
MKLSRAAVVLAALGCWPAGAATAAQETIEGVTFEAPEAGAGWERKAGTSFTVFQKTIVSDKGRKSSAMIQVAAPLSVGPEQFDANFTQFSTSVTELTKEKPSLKADGLTPAGRRIRTEWRCCARVQGVSVGQRTAGIASDDRQVFVVLLTFNLRGDEGKAAEAAFAGLVRSLKLDPSDGTALVPAKGNGGLEGAFTHLDTGLRLNAFGGTDFYSQSRIKVFDKSGLYSNRLPEDGDLAAHCAKTPADCGLYALKGGGWFSGASEIELRDVVNQYGVIETRTRAFETDGDDVKIGKDRHVRLKPLEDGTPLQGSWRYFFASTGSTAFSSNSVSSERTLTFDTGGRFARTGFTSASSTSDMGGGTTGFTAGGRRPEASGTYRIDGFTLTLTDEAGKVEKLSVFAPDKGSDGLLVINGSNYLKKK